MRESANRYSRVSVVLHWTIALLILANVLVGGWMEDAEGSAAADYFSVHATIGIAVLLLSLLRLGWRIGHPWPALPDPMPKWERALARTTHCLFYVLMIGAPLLGWAAVSAYGGGGIAMVAGIEWPALPLNGGGAALGAAHKLAVKAIYVVLALHVAGALKHHFVNGDAVLFRMLPLSFLRRHA